jgi:hypothetical protein
MALNEVAFIPVTAKILKDGVHQITITTDLPERFSG